jgi:hypothetical protein
MHLYNKELYYVDFSDRDDLSEDEKTALHAIQETYRPIERTELLIEYKVNGKITNDDWETMTGLSPYM